MSAYIKMRVKDANAFSKGLSSNVGGFGMFTRYSVWLYVDGVEIGKLTASRIPYTVEILPGVHRLQLLRNRQGSINVAKGVSKAVFGGAAALIGGGEGEFLGAIADTSMRMTEGDPKKGQMTLTLQEGQTVELVVRAGLKGHPIPKQV